MICGRWLVGGIFVVKKILRDSSALLNHRTVATKNHTSLQSYSDVDEQSVGICIEQTKGLISEE